VSVLCIVLIAKQLLTARPPATPRGRPAVGASAATAPAGDSRLPPQAYNVIASRNLFSPTRSETAGPALAGGAPVLVAKPALHGVVLREGSPIAYLEDPLTKRIAGYRVGDPIAGGTVQTISADTVVIARPEGMVDVRLRDPSKPRPAPPQPGAQQPMPGQQAAWGSGAAAGDARTTHAPSAGGTAANTGSTGPVRSAGAEPRSPHAPDSSGSIRPAAAGADPVE